MSDTSGVTPSKPFATSLTIQGIFVSLIGAFTPQIASLLHIQTGDVTQLVAAAATLIGAVLAVIGRMKATQPLH